MNKLQLGGREVPYIKKNDDNMQPQTIEEIESMILQRTMENIQIRIPLPCDPSNLIFTQSGADISLKFFNYRAIKFANGIWIKRDGACRFDYIFNIIKFNEPYHVIWSNNQNHNRFDFQKIVRGHLDLDQMRLGQSSREQSGEIIFPEQKVFDINNDGPTTLRYIFSVNLPQLFLASENNICNPLREETIFFPDKEMILPEVNHYLANTFLCQIIRYYYVKTSSTCQSNCCSHLLFIIQDIMYPAKYAALYLAKHGEGIKFQSIVTIENDSLESFKSFGFKENLKHEMIFHPFLVGGRHNKVNADMYKKKYLKYKHKYINLKKTLN